MSKRLVNHRIYNAFLILLLVGSLLSSFGASGTSVVYAQETAVYVNEFDGYSVSYPMNWHLYPAKESGAGVDISSSASAEMIGSRLNIIAFDNAQALPVSDWHAAYVANLVPVRSGDISGLEFHEYTETIYDFLEVGPLTHMQVVYVDGVQKIFRLIKFCNNKTDCSALDGIIQSFALHNTENNISALSLPITYPYEDKEAATDVVALGQHVDQESPVALHAPWQYGAAFVLNGSYYGEGAHNDANNDFYATDWSKVGTSCDQDAGQPVLAAGTGKAILARNYDPGLNSGGKVVRIQSNIDSTVTFAIYHLQDVSVAQDEMVTSLPKQIGTVGETGMDAASSCAHIHLSVRRTIGGTVYSIRSGNLSSQTVSDGVTITSYNGGGGGGGTGIDCGQVTYNGVVLYENANCNKDQNGSKKEFSSSTGWTDIVSDFNDITSSIYIKSGWSMKVFEKSVGEGGGSWRCLTGSMWDLNVDYYTNGDTGRKINNDISSVQVFSNSNNCGSGGGGGTGTWNVKYFNGHDHWWDNNNFNNQMCQESITSTGLDKNYGSSAPCGNGVTDHWVAEYNATINFPAGNYVFQAQNDDGLKLWLNGNNILERGGSQGLSYICPARPLNGNATLRAILNEEGGDARIKIAWTTDTSICNLPGSFSKASPSNGAGSQSNNPTLSWNGSSGANNYSYCIDTSNNNSCDTGWVGVGNVTSKALSGLSTGTTYYWHVRAHSEGGETYSNGNAWWAFTTQVPVPATPSNFRISSSTQTSITLAWDDVSNEFGYNIYDWNGTDFVYLASVDANTTSYTEIRGECGWDEFYQVSAYNGNGESGRTGWIQGYTKPCNPTLNTPGNASTNPYNYDLTFEWNSTPGATEYLLEWWGGPYTTMQPCGWSSVTSCHIGTVAPGNTYSWHVKARNSAGESNWSNTWTFTIQPEAVPDLIVQTITASPSNPAINQPITFTVRIKNQGTGAINSSFYVDLFLDRQPATDCGDSSLIWWQVESLAAGATRDLQLTYAGFSTSGAHNFTAFADTNCHIAEGNEGNNIMGPIGIAVQQGPAPAAFNKSSPLHGATGQPTSPTLSWQASSGASSYEYCYDTTNDNACSNWISNGTSTSKALSGLNAGTTHYWHVRALNAAGMRYSNGSGTAFWSFKTQPAPVTMTVYATVEDGWVVESSESSNTGGGMNASATTFVVGDDPGDKQYRGILSFNTAGLPDNAVVTGVTLKVMHQSVTGTNPFATHGNIIMDIFRGAFGGNVALQVADFQATASRSAAATITNTPSAGWYSSPLGSGVYVYINKAGVTQIRLRFAIDDNDDLSADYLRLYSGNATTANRPKLIIQYYVP